MSAQSNVFSALQPEKRKNKTAEPQNKMFASFVNNASTSAWGDDSDDEHAAEPAVEEAVAEEEEESESESESEEEEEEEEPEKPAAPKKAEPPARTLSKKEKKELEMKEFEAALADLGIKAEDAPQPKEEKKEETPAASSSDKKKKKKKGKKPAKAVEPETATPEVVDIKALVKSKGKKKKAAEPAAVRIAREEKARAKAKGKKDKSSFNEFSI